MKKKKKIIWSIFYSSFNMGFHDRPGMGNNTKFHLGVLFFMGAHQKTLVQSWCQNLSAFNYCLVLHQILPVWHLCWPWLASLQLHPHPHKTKKSLNRCCCCCCMEWNIILLQHFYVWPGNLVSFLNISILHQLFGPRFVCANTNKSSSFITC